MKKAKTLMVQGTSSNCGKILPVAAFCKIFSDTGYRVASFKAQNMSSNSFVTRQGAEIARALQAFAAGVEPADINPVLLKPKGGMTSQIIFQGRPYGDVRVESTLSSLSPRCVEALTRLRAECELILIEGTRSQAEINLYEFEVQRVEVTGSEGVCWISGAEAWGSCLDRGGELGYG